MRKDEAEKIKMAVAEKALKSGWVHWDDVEDIIDAHTAKPKGRRRGKAKKA